MADMTIQGLHGETIKAGDRVLVSWCPGTRANGVARAEGVIQSIRVGGFYVEFDEPRRHESTFTGVTKRRNHYICMHSHGGPKRNTFALDGYPCSDGEEYVTKIEAE